jgi:hypothetical protein
MPKENTPLYDSIIERIFQDHYKARITSFEFSRNEMPKVVKELKLNSPKTYGDVIYSFHYRKPLPDSINATAPKGKEWIIEGGGKGRYVFKLVTINRVIPNPGLVTIKIPDATPEIISSYALSDEQALLAKLRYNRLVDTFFGITVYSLQNHLRTTVRKIGQIEIDEIYIGIDRRGCQYIIPVQAKSGNDQLSVVQTKQDIAYCTEKFPELICRSLSAQFMADDLMAMFELTVEEDGKVKIVDEKHYKLVPSEDIESKNLRAYRGRR